MLNYPYKLKIFHLYDTGKKMAEDKSNEIKLKSISELLGMTFFIPSYQRGYRWDKQQVEDLLEDICAFADKKNKSEKEFYCLQPIVVRKFNKNDEETTKNLTSELNNNEWYEVIDGQQRLTTIKILISYLVKELYPGKTLYDKHKKNIFEILYETRPDSISFLNTIDNSKSNDFIDYYYISTAYNVIKEWFDSPEMEDPQQSKESIRNTLLYGINNQKQEGIVQVIWYELNDKNNKPIDTFLRINMGKIPLTNAELIKALFLQKRNFVTGEVEGLRQKGNLAADDAIELRQMEIASEWDNIEYALQNEDFWGFLNKEKNEVPARIEFLFNLIYELEWRKDKKKFDDWYGTDEHKVFRYFNKLFDEKSEKITYEIIKGEWDKIKDYFYAFEEWFNKPVWYHYIGFLIYCGVSVVDIYKIYKDKKKKEFTKALIDKIKAKFKIEYEKDEDGNFVINMSFENSAEELRQFFLLFNIEYIIKQYNEKLSKNKGKEDDLFIIKFPFKIFNNEKWHIEHIDSYTPNSITKVSDQKTWLKTNRDDLKGEIDDETLLEIEIFLKTDNPGNFEELYKKLSLFTSENEIDKDKKNSIGNLTLLNEEINCSYGNALFPVKRHIIIKEDMQGKFIPICTKHVFLKYFDEKGTSRTKWGSDDIKNYQNHIGNVLEIFLLFKGENNE
jgi:uncharacterized protein with ParB-like and HNH nuclease domain